MSRKDHHKTSPIVKTQPAKSIGSTLQTNELSSDASQGERRKEQRVPSQLNAMYSASSVSHIAEVGNISSAGLQLTIRRGIMPAVGAQISVRFARGAGRDAVVQWTEDNRLGACFLEPIEAVDSLLEMEDLGGEHFLAIVSFQIAQSRP